MANKNFIRTASGEKRLQELHLQPPPELPASIMRSFPEMRAWNDQVQEAHRRNEQEIRRAMAEMIAKP